MSLFKLFCFLCALSFRDVNEHGSLHPTQLLICKQYLCSYHYSSLGSSIHLKNIVNLLTGFFTSVFPCKYQILLVVFPHCASQKCKLNLSHPKQKYPFRYHFPESYLAAHEQQNKLQWLRERLYFDKCENDHSKSWSIIGSELKCTINCSTGNADNLTPRGQNWKLILDMWHKTKRFGCLWP